MKKKIGISFTETNFKNYWNWFTDKDLKNNVELVELSFERNNEGDIYNCDGFLLTGGVDIHPSLYGGATDYEDKPDAFFENRDKFEEKIYRFSQLNIKPVLGICRGLQLINVLHGGKLIQHLKGFRDETHDADTYTDKQHQIRIERDTLLFNAVRSEIGSVNSAHHQAADPAAIGDNLIVNAYAFEEQIIEGLEFKDKTNKAYMLAVQWHPERVNDPESVFSKNIKQSFLEAVREGV